MYYAASIVLILSFVALGVLWRRPLLEGRVGGRPLSERWQRLVLWVGWRVILGALAVGLLALVWLAALVGEPDAGDNVAPTFVYVVFWLGLVPLVVVFGNLWSVLSPWRAAADAVAWAWGKAGRDWEPAAAYPERLGRWPAAGLLLAFATLELAYPRAAEPRTLALAIVVYSWVTWAGMLLYGRRTWTENGEAFHVYFGLLALIAPFAVQEREGRRVIVVRPPLAGLTARQDTPGTVAFVAVMLGSVAFDGFSRTNRWQDWLYEVEARYIVDSPRTADLVATGFNLLGLLAWSRGRGKDLRSCSSAAWSRLRWPTRSRTTSRCSSTRGSSRSHSSRIRSAKGGTSSGPTASSRRSSTRRTRSGTRRPPSSSSATCSGSRWRTTARSRSGARLEPRCGRSTRCSP
jgi:hypothetical protein